MIKSMTGFGRCEVEEGNRKVTVEMKSVNHRYLDVNIKMPKKLSFFESSIRNELKNYVQRGKIDIFISYEDFSENNVCIKYNKELAAEYLKYLREMSTEFGLDDDIRVSTLSRYPEVFSMEEQMVDEEEIWKVLSKAIDGAAESFVETRIKEGQNLADDLVAKLDGMLEHVAFIEERSPQTVKEYNDKLLERIRNLIGDINVDEQRLLTEAAIFADKVAVAEETVRLRSHIDQLHMLLESSDPIGRKLDFLAQEMNREANTIGSKAQDVDITKRVLNIKAEVEKIREQIQNIE